jgi:cytochrome c5
MPVIFALAIAPEPANAQGDGRSGKAVVDAACIACHGSGAKGAPKIGDTNAWSKRAALGLTGLTENALKGIRQMPPHGGSPGLTDIEIERAITYMVNQSGGNWAEPVNKANTAVSRSGEQVVSLQCSKCHDSGVGGAPKIGDRAAWIPRLKQGIDPLVRSAINGHGGMPPRGGTANLTDAELRGAIVYMLNAGTVPAKAGPVAIAAGGQNFKVVEGITVYFGVVSADAIRANPNEYPSTMYGVAPSAPDQYYVTVSLYDANNGQRITDASVRARVSSAGGAGPEKVLDPTTVANSLTYGNYFAMAGAGTYQVSLHVRRPGMADGIQTQFEYMR